MGRPRKNKIVKQHKVRKELTTCVSHLWTPPPNIDQIAYALGYHFMRPRDVCYHFGITIGAWGMETKKNPIIMREYRRGQADALFNTKMKLHEVAQGGDIKAITLILRFKDGWTDAPGEALDDFKELPTPTLLALPSDATDAQAAAKAYMEMMTRKA